MANDFGFDASEKEPYYFISYNSEDAEKAAEYCRLLNNNSVPLWYDGGIPHDEYWEEIIAEKIDHCNAVILFYTNAILKKDESYVIKEFKIARLYEKKVYCVLLENINARGASYKNVRWALDLKELHTIDATDQNTEKAVSEIMNAVGLKNDHETSAAEKAPASAHKKEKKLKAKHSSAVKDKSISLGRVKE